MTPNKHDLSSYPDVLAFAEKHLGSINTALFKGWEHAESLVWKLELKSGRGAYLKVHKQVRKSLQEIHAYKNWVPEVQGLAPKLLAFKKGKPSALLISDLKAPVVETLKLSVKQEQAVYKQAGAFLARYHAIAFKDNDIPLGDAFQKRTTTWTQRAKGIMIKSDIDWVSARVFEALPMLNTYKRVPCHRDFTARNWLFDETQTLRVIDFEHSRSDLWFLDVERLWASTWQDRPDLQSAFWQGYGRDLSLEEKELLARCAALGALSTIVWAKEHNDKPFEAHGRRVLAQLMNNA